MELFVVYYPECCRVSPSHQVNCWILTMRCRCLHFLHSCLCLVYTYASTYIHVCLDIYLLSFLFTSLYPEMQSTYCRINMLRIYSDSLSTRNPESWFRQFVNPFWVHSRSCYLLCFWAADCKRIHACFLCFNSGIRSSMCRHWCL